MKRHRRQEKYSASEIVRCLIWLIWILLFSLMQAHAQDAPRPVIISPLPGDTVYGNEVRIRYRLEGDRNLLGVEHLYLKLDRETCTYTPGFDGEHIFTGLTPGPHHFLLWMETGDYIQTGSITEIQVTLVSDAEVPKISLQKPASRGLTRSSDISVEYSIAGGIMPVSFSHLSLELDGSNVLQDTAVSGKILLPQVRDGVHRLRMQIVTLSGGLAGSEAEIQFEVKSDLSPEQAGAVKRLLKKLSRSRLSQAARGATEAKVAALLKKMGRAGSMNPDHPGINQEEVKKAKKILRKFQGGNIKKTDIPLIEALFL